MNDRQKDRLERNLSQSAAGAKIYWVRALIGPGVEQQGFIDPKLLPIDRTNLGEFYQSTKINFEDTRKTLSNMKEIILELEKKLEEYKKKNEKLEKRIRDLEGFQLD